MENYVPTKTPIKEAQFLTDEEFNKLMQEKFYSIIIPTYPKGINFTPPQSWEFKNYLFDLRCKLSDLEYEMGRLVI